MTTTSLKLSDEIKQKVANCAHKQGLSPHAFMVQAIEQAVKATERQAKFLLDAKNAHADSLRTGQGYDAAEVHRYILARSKAATSSRPRVINWRN